MNTYGWTERRLLVPRWRSFARTLAAGELNSSRSRAASTKKTDFQTDVRLARWIDRPNLVTAAEVVEAALGEAREGDAVEAARQVLRDHPTAMPMVRNQAATLLRRAGQVEEVKGFAGSIEPADAAGWRASLRLYPYDAIGWIELAFHQVVNGHSGAAARSIAVALALAPHNRHVLRSAARFYLHRDEHERAHDMIVRSPISRRDPWLLSAEIALARAAERSSRLIKVGETVLKEGDFSALDLSELAGAIGTEYLIEGRRGLRKMFLRSLEDPTASALAQGEWASREMGDDLVPNERIERVPEAFEALAFHRYREFRFAEIPDICDEWAKIDRFSVRPFEFGSTAAAHALDFERAAAMAKAGLKLRPMGAGLLNSLAFALGSLGDIEGAMAALHGLAPDKLSDLFRFVRAANVGLCAFRLGHTDDGIGEYRKAIEGLNKINAHVESASARAYLAREAAIAGLSDAPKFLHEAEEALRPFKTAAAHLVLRRLRGENVDAQLADAREAQDQARRLARLRSLTWTVPGLPGDEGLIHRLHL
jgi:tetratricopeptide (TPR) repeat protein